MIPYWPQPVWRLGPVTIHGFGLLAAAAMLTGYFCVIRRARNTGYNPVQAGRVALLCALIGLAAGILAGGSHGQGHNEVSFTASGLATLASAAFAAWKQGSWKLLDILAWPAVPLALGLARTGCFLAHDHIGQKASEPPGLWLAVAFPDASGGGVAPAYDLGLLQALGAFAVAAIIQARAGRKLPPPPGALFAAVVAGIAATRLAALSAGYPGTLDWLAATAALAGGLALLAARKPST